MRPEAHEAGMDEVRYPGAPAPNSSSAVFFWRDRLAAIRIVPTVVVVALGVSVSLALWQMVERQQDAELAVVVLAAGLVISALLGALVYVAEIARSSAGSPVPARADLHGSTRETERQESEIRALRGSLEARVAERTATLQEAIEELETFNYSVSHDLRSPIGAVINFAAILTNDYGHVLDDEGRDHLRRISRSASVAVSLMDGLLAFSHSGREELRKTIVDMRSLVESVCDDLAAADPGCRDRG